VHAERVRNGRIEWTAIVRFYEQLSRISPTIGMRTGYAAALAETNQAERGLAVLDSINADAVSCYQPYWAVIFYSFSGRPRSAARLRPGDRTG
jgi:RNA polymerase sigma-70 factor, ECF subfamily